MDYDKMLEMYDEILSEGGFVRQGKSMPFTSHNGYMFTLLNKAGEIGFRYSKQRQKEYFEKFNTSYFISYNAKMQGYILLTDEILNDRELTLELLKESYDYICTLEPK